MKKFLLLSILFSCIVIVGFSQGTSWEKAANCGCYFQTDPKVKFTWSGGISNGYCNGYGTIQWYDSTYGDRSDKYVGNLKNGKADGYATMYRSNGSIYYQGYWKDDMMHGKGTMYNDDGTVLYKGMFEKDEFKYLGTLKSDAREAAYNIVKDGFGGGTNVKSVVKKAVFNDDGTIHELWVYISFNGDIVTTNKYYFTIKYNEDWAIPADFYDYSENSKPYLLILVASEIIKYFKT